MQKLKGDRWIKHEGWGWGDIRTEAERQRDHNVKRQRTEGHCQHMAQRSSWLLCNAWLFSWKWWQPMNMHHSAHGPQPSYFRGQAVTRRAWHMWPHLHNLKDTPQQKNSVLEQLCKSQMTENWKPENILALFICSAETVNPLKTTWEDWLRICGESCMAGFRPDMPDRWTDEIRHIDVYQTR